MVWSRWVVVWDALCTACSRKRQEYALAPFRATSPRHLACTRPMKACGLSVSPPVSVLNAPPGKFCSFHDARATHGGRCFSGRPSFSVVTPPSGLVPFSGHRCHRPPPFSPVALFPRAIAMVQPHEIAHRFDSDNRSLDLISILSFGRSSGVLTVLKNRFTSSPEQKPSSERG